MADTVAADVAIVGGGPGRPRRGAGPAAPRRRACAGAGARARGRGRAAPLRPSAVRHARVRPRAHRPGLCAGGLSSQAVAAGVDDPNRAFGGGGRAGRPDPAHHPGRAAVVEARRAILATGVRESSRHARLMSGDRPLGVVTTGTLQAMVYLKNLVPFRRPVIVGTELVSLSSLLTCRRAGIRPVAMIEANARPTARAGSGAVAAAARHPGPLWRRAARDSRPAAGRERHPAAGRRRRRATIACDGVLLTGCFVPEAALVRAGHLELDPGSGGPVIDQFGRCSDPTWFAAGNVLRPVETAGWSFREGQRIGACVADDLAGRLPVGQRDRRSRAGPGHQAGRAAAARRCRSAGRPATHLQLRVSERDRGRAAASPPTAADLAPPHCSAAGAAAAGPLARADDPACAHRGLKSASA